MIALVLLSGRSLLYGYAGFLVAAGFLGWAVHRIEDKQ